ncbi:hypothetical protein ACFL5M_02390 [Candidatus Neomarinimicrobiota bacterium]
MPDDHRFERAAQFPGQLAALREQLQAHIRGLAVVLLDEYPYVFGLCTHGRPLSENVIGHEFIHQLVHPDL